MAEGSVRVKGLRETQRALGKCEGGVGKTMLAAGKAAAEPVAVSAREKIGRYAGASVGTIRPRASVRGAFVTQGARKVTGLRGDYGKLQMGLMIEALDEERGHVIELYELGLYRLTKSAGF
jgi:hypothetical protein